MTTPVVDYAMPTTRSSRGDAALVRLAFGCALLPMTAGLLVMVAWLLSGNPVFELLGFLVIVFGVPLFGVGMICCLVAAARCVAGKRPWRTWLPRTALAAALLLANIPLAATCVQVADISRVRVVNNSSGVVTSFVVTDPAGRTWQLAPIPPGSSTSRMMSFDGEGAVTYMATTTLTSGAINSGGTIDSYITPSGATGRRYTVTINADGTSRPPPPVR